MQFQHSPQIWECFPALAPGVLYVEGITFDRDVAARIGAYEAVARSRLAQTAEGEWPEVQAWRRAFSQMGLKPTQYRCASESLLRRFRKEGALPRLHPLVDLCNAMSLAFGIPIAVFDVSRIAQRLEVRYATGGEHYQSFAGDIEHPERGEVVFVDAENRAHARRWTHRQSALSAIRQETAAVLIVAEALHHSAFTDVSALIDALAGEVKPLWAEPSVKAILSKASPSIACSSFDSAHSR
jgi:DNA/RNA-binding domain of Phe-tRNA-synthetase-like protein